MATVVYYGDVVLHNVVTREFLQEPVRDDSQTDRVYDRVRYMCETVVTPSVISDGSPNCGAQMANAMATDSAGLLIGHLLGQLNKDRQIFELWMEGRLILRCIPSPSSNSGDVDVNNGPKVIHFKTTNIAPATIRIEWGVEIALVFCEDDRLSYPVLSNRWSCTDDLDENFRTTRYWRGKLRVSEAIYNPQRFRGMIVPRLQRGWKRQRMHFTGEANALELSYEIIDVEMVGQAPPDPATKMRCSHTESFEQSGMVQHGNLSVRLDGPRGANKKHMLQRCVQILLNKLRVSTADNDIFESMILVDHIGDDINAVEVSGRVIRIPKNADMGNLQSTNFAAPLSLPQYDGDVAVIKGPYGTADLAGVFACYLQDPCENQHAFPADESGESYLMGNPSDRGDQPATNIWYSAGPATNDMAIVGSSILHDEGMYTHLQIESHYERDDNRVALPIAKSAASASTKRLQTIQLAPPTMLRRVRMSAERTGKHVNVWQPGDFTANGIDHKLLEFTPNLRPPTVLGDGKKMYAVDAEYLFALEQTPDSDAPLPVGALFWDTTDPASNQYNQSQYIQLSGFKGLQ